MRQRTTAWAASAALVAALGIGVPGLAGIASPAAAAPTSATDETKIPHYFGPYPNWALSQLTSANATVTITPGASGGAGAAATANVGSDGAITSIDVTNPGHDYGAGTTVSITGSGSGAVATATVQTTGGVIGYTVGAAGAGYSEFAVTVAAPTAGTTATAEASGGVDAVAVVAPGSGYTAPTVEFDLPDLPDGVQAKGHAVTADDGLGNTPPTFKVTGVVVDSPGSGYTKAPGIAVHNGTTYDPIAGATLAVASTTLSLGKVTAVDVGSGYGAAPTVTVSDPTGTGTGAAVTATTDVGAITGIAVSSGGRGYLTPGIKKFKDPLPNLCDPSSAKGCPTPAVTGPAAPDMSTKAIPVAVPAAKTYSGQAADEYVIGLVQYRTRFASDLPPTTVRGYVQLETADNAAWSKHVVLTNTLLDGTTQAIKNADDSPVLAVTEPQWLGPVIAATKDKPVRIVFRNLLPKGTAGDLFLPVDSSMMGSGMGPMPMAEANSSNVLDGVRNPLCTDDPTNTMCFTQNRATLHLHGGTTPWISDGTPHQWITPAKEGTAWPQGVAVSDVPDMVDTTDNSVLCAKGDDGCQTFYYTNEQSARLMFYHDHAWGITRLNVYAGEAAGYLIGDETEKKLISSGTIPGAADTIPLVVQDRTFVPDDAQLALQDPTWDATKWGTKGSFWYHHVYMPAQNPGDPSGMSAYGRWMYGPWFWPPATGTKYPPIDNPYYDANCNLDVPSTWQYQTDPFCEPKQIPGTPNISAGMEQFNDTPVVNGVAYPTLTLEPKSYRLRMLNAANDRFFNFQWYLADTDKANGGDGVSSGTEVKLDPTLLAQAQTDPNVFPTPVNDPAIAGPDWLQIGTEGGFLPQPATIDGQQPTTWITDPTRFDVGNVDKHSMLLAPAERSDVIVDFSKFAGKTLILYNDAPAAFPARVASYDYYTGAPDLSPNGAPKILPGYGPNTRTVMQVKIAGTAAPAFNATKLRNAFQHTVAKTGVFESGQHPIIVGQKAYNTTYGTSFGSGNCNQNPSSPTCDGQVRVNDTSSFTFNTLRGGVGTTATKTTMPLQPKAIHDEMNSTTFDEYGRMQANLGIEAQPPTPGAQNVTLYPYVNPTTELIDGTSLPDASVQVTPMGTAGDDGSQIWRITHNGVDTHPIHFHLFDVQLLNRVTWDNIIIPPDPEELGWKDTVRVSPLEDTIVALRPVVPKTPFEVPNSVRPLNPMMPLNNGAMFNNVDTQGAPLATAITNQIVNFGWEYVYHCHILSHEEMDMMRPVDLALPPITADGLWTEASGANWKLHWNDNSITETDFQVERSTDAGATWTLAGTLPTDIRANTHGVKDFLDTGSDSASTTTQYRVVARNTVGYGNGLPSMTVKSTSKAVAAADVVAPSAPTGLTGSIAVGPSVDLGWTDTATTETGFVVQRRLTVTTGTPNAWTTVGTVGANAVAFNDTGVTPGATYDYQVYAVDGGRPSAPSNVLTLSVTVPSAPTGLSGNLVNGPGASLTWTNTATNATGVVVEKSVDGGAWAPLTTLAASAVTYTDPLIAVGSASSYRVRATNAVGDSAPSNTVVVTAAVPLAASNVVATVGAGPSVTVTWTNNATDATTLVVEREVTGSGSWTPVADLLPGTATAVDNGPFTVGTSYTYRVGTTNVVSTVYASSNPVTPVPAAQPAPSGLTATVAPATITAAVQVNLAWTDNATAETGTVVERSTTSATTGFTPFATLTGTPGAGPVTASDLTVVPGTTYWYRVGATANGAPTAYSNVATVTLVAAPTAPSGFRTQILSGPTRVRVFWTDASTNETGFSVQRSVNGGAWTQVSTTTARTGTGTALTFTQNATAGQTVAYRVAAFNASAYSYTPTITLRVGAPPAPAVTFPATATSTSTTRQSIPLSWASVPEATDCRVQWRTGPGAATTTATVTTTSYTITNLTKRSWQVRVGARNALGTTYTAWTTVNRAP